MSGLDKYRKLGLLNDEDYFKILAEPDKEIEKETERAENNCIAMLQRLGYSL
jgi:hypothetical protein